MTDGSNVLTYSDAFRNQVVYISTSFETQRDDLKRVLVNHGGTFTNTPEGKDTIHLLEHFKGVCKIGSSNFLEF